MKRKNKQDTVGQIKIDKKTNEPIIVQVPLDDIKADVDKEHENVTIKKADFVEEKSTKGVGKQIAMERVLGFNPKDSSINKRQKRFKLIFTITFIVFIVGVLAFTFYKDFFAQDPNRDVASWEEILDIFSKSWKYLIFAILAVFFYLVFKGFKLSVMCKRLTGKFHFKTCVETGIIGQYYNCVTPLAVGGQPFEIYHLSKHGVHGGAASSMPIAAFFLNQFAFVILGILSLILFQCNAIGLSAEALPGFTQVVFILAIIGLACCLLVPLLVIVFSLMPKTCAKLVRFVIMLGAKLRIVKNPNETIYKTIKTVYHNSKCLKKIASNPFMLILTFMISVLEWLATCTIAYFSLKLFGYGKGSQTPFLLEWFQVVVLCVILYSAISFVPTPGNSGAADLSFFLLFEMGIAGGLVFPAMVVWRSLCFYSYIVLGFLFATFKKRADLKRNLATVGAQLPESEPNAETSSAPVDSNDSENK